MSMESLSQFFEAIAKDEALQEKLRKAPDMKDVVKVAEESGFSVTAEDLATLSRASQALFRASHQPKLSYEKLEAVTGLVVGSTSDNFNLGEGLLLAQKAMRLRELVGVAGIVMA